MNKYPLIVVSICTVVLLVLGSLSNVVGYQSVKSTAMNESPLFSTRMKRAINQENKSILTSYYLGKGTKLSFVLPTIDDKIVLFKKVIQKIIGMNDEQFENFISIVVKEIREKNLVCEEKIPEIIKTFKQFRNNPELLINNQINNKENPPPYPTFDECPFTMLPGPIGCGIFCVFLLLTLPFWVVFAAMIFFYSINNLCISPFPPAKSGC